MLKMKKIYGTKSGVKSIALDGVSFSVEKGEFVGIMGPSGAGKSTLLNVIATIDTVSDGEIIIGDQNICQIKEPALSDFRRNRLGFIFQDYNLLEAFLILFVLSGIRAYTTIYRYQLIDLLSASKQNEGIPGYSKLAAVISLLLLAFGYGITFFIKLDISGLDILPEVAVAGIFVLIGTFLLCRNLVPATIAALRKTGMKKHEILSSITRQLGMVYGFPLIVGLVHTLFGLLFYNRALGDMGKQTPTLQNALLYVLLFIGVYVIFYALSVRSYFSIVWNRIKR